MSFYTALTGLNGAQADIAAISNNIANVGTTGFKRSRAEFGDIFATSPLQAASSAIGSGTILKSIKQQFTQGNIESSLNALDLAISGQGFFALKPSLTSTQTVFTRNGSFSVNNDRYVVDSQGQLLQVFPVNADGSVIATGAQSAKNLQLPTTSGLPKASQTIQLGLNLPADATIIPNSATYSKSNPYVFDKTNAATYNQSTSITIYDSLGNPTIATIYYVKTSNATEASPTNKWQTHVFVGDREVTPQLITAKDDQGRTAYINKFGTITYAPQTIDPTFNSAAAHPLFKQDDQTNKLPSTAASIAGAIIKTSGFDFGDTDANKVVIVTDPAHYKDTREGSSTNTPPSYWGTDMFTISVDGSAPQSISVNAGTYTGTQLASELTRAVNEKFGGAHYFKIIDTYRKDGGGVVPGNDVIQLNLSMLSEDGSPITMANPIEIDLLGTAGSSGTPQVGGSPAAANKLQLTRDQLVTLAQTKLNDALNLRHLEFGKPPSWPNSETPPIKVGYDVASRSLTFTVDPAQMGPDANEPTSRFNSIQVYNPTDLVNDLGIPPKTTSTDSLIRANTLWSGNAALPGGDPVVDPREQRTGIQVAYNKDTRQFSFSSGSTGEASLVTVGRAVLATANDKQPQIDSYDLSTLPFDKNQTVSLEVDGREITYNYMAPTGNLASDSTAFMAGIQQKIPVTFSPAGEVQAGTTTSSEIQSLNVFGKLMYGDEFNLKLAPAPGVDPVDVHIGPLEINPGDDTTTRLNKFTAAINAGIAAYNAITTGRKVAVLATPVENQITFTYDALLAPGLVSGMVSIKQTMRGTDASFGIVQGGTASVVAGSVAAPTTFTSTITPTPAVGDKYTITLPGLSSPVALTLTAEGVDGLVAAANLDASLSALVTFTGAGGVLTGTFKANGAQAGDFKVSKNIQTITATVATPGAVGTAEIFNAAISPAPVAGDTFSIKVPGQAAAVTLTLATSGGIDALVTTANNNATLSALVTFSNVAGVFTGTFKATGVQTGSYSISQTFNTAVESTVTAAQGTLAANAVQTLPLHSVDGLGASLKIGDTYTVTVPVPGGSSVSASVTLTADGLDGLVAAASANSTLSAAATFSKDTLGTSLVATNLSYGAVTGAISVVQTHSASTSMLTADPYALTEATVVSQQTQVQDGTGTTQAIQSVALVGTDGLSAPLKAGDTYQISIPKPNGEVVTREITLTADGIQNLMDQAALNSDFSNVVTFSKSGDSLVAKYNANGHVTGKMAIIQTAVAGVNVRPDYIGPLSVGSSGTNLEVTGDPTGASFRLNLRIKGAVRSLNPVGAQGSTSRIGLQVGQAKSLSYAGSNDLLGIGDKYVAQEILKAGTGLASSAATAVGSRGVTPMNQTFFLNESLGENKMTFTVDGIVGAISLPIRAYTGDTFASAIQDRVNQIQDPKTGRIVSGVTVKFEPDNNRLVFTSGTTGANSQINVVGHANFGLATVTQTPGNVPIITKLTQATDEQGNNLYVDAEGNISTQAPPAQSVQNWYPLYLQEGQLTFDTIGKLISPKEGVAYSPFDPQNGSDLLRLNIDYGKFSTQFSSPFSVLSLSQDGYASGSLNGLDIDASGTIRANYTNGQTAALGKIMVANFANANGLKQVGNADYVATSVSGNAVLGQAGADGFGTIKAGALERSNVDITEELVNLITAQRNFQANAKAIETTTTLSQTIIQIRG